MFCRYCLPARLERTDVAARLGFVAKPKLREYDLSIYGAGPAGLSAAGYAVSQGFEHGADRAQRRRRTGGHDVADRELHGVSRSGVAEGRSIPLLTAGGSNESKYKAGSNDMSLKSELLRKDVRAWKATLAAEPLLRALADVSRGSSSDCPKGA
jgi:hypothetical protein